MALKLAVLLAACLFGAGSSIAAEYPNKTLQLVVPFAAGGAGDIFARLIGDYLSRQFEQPVVLENRPGAGGNVATQAVINAAPDGYTLLLVSHTNAINATLYRNLKFDFLKQIIPVSGIAHVPNTLLVSPSLPVNTLVELIDYAKKNPRKLNIASTGHGTSGHLAGELLKLVAGIDIVHVPYRGTSPLMADLIGGQVQLALVTAPTSLPYVQSGKLRALAVTSAKRLNTLPDVPTATEAIPDFVVGGWFGVGVPAGTSQAVVDRLSSTINGGLENVEIAARLYALSAVPHVVTAPAYREFVEAETERWGRVVTSAGVRVE